MVSGRLKEVQSPRLLLSSDEQSEAAQGVVHNPSYRLQVLLEGGGVLEAGRSWLLRERKCGECEYSQHEVRLFIYSVRAKINGRDVKQS